MTDLLEMTHQEIFDRYASIVVDRDVYHTNMELRRVLDAVLFRHNLKSKDVTPKGAVIYRDHAMVEVWERDSKGSQFVRGGSLARKWVRLNL